MRSSSPLALSSLLPESSRQKLEAIRLNSITLLGQPRPLQQIVDLSRSQIDHLIIGGIQLAELAILLAEVGIVSKTGLPFPSSTLSSALSRNQRRHIAGRCTSRHAAATYGNSSVETAPDGKMRENAAASGSSRRSAATSGELSLPSIPAAHGARGNGNAMSSGAASARAPPHSDASLRASLLLRLTEDPNNEA